MKIITHTALAITLALTFAAPAKAENDAAKVVAGLIGVAILGAVIADLADNDHHTTQVVTPRRNHGHGHVHGGYGHVQTRPLPPHVKKHVRAKNKTRRCNANAWHRRNPDLRKGHGRSCLKRHGDRHARN